MANQIIVSPKLADDGDAANPFLAQKFIDNGDGSFSFILGEQPTSDHPALAQNVNSTGLVLKPGASAAQLTRVNDPDGYSHNGFFAIPWTGVIAGQDTLGAWSASNPTRLTAAVAGVYYFDLTIIVTGLAANIAITVFPRVNGVTNVFQWSYGLLFVAATGGANTISLSFTYNLSAGQYMEFWPSTGAAFTLFPIAGMTKL